MCFELDMKCSMLFFLQNPETGGTGGKRFTFKNLSARLRGEDTSYEAQLATAEKELKEAEESLSNIQKEFEYDTRRKGILIFYFFFKKGFHSRCPSRNREIQHAKIRRFSKHVNQLCAITVTHA